MILLNSILMDEIQAPLLKGVKKERKLILTADDDGSNPSRKLAITDMLKSSDKTERQYKLREQLYQMDEEMKLYDRDSQDLEALNTRVDDLRSRISKVLDSVKGKIDFARARLMTLG